MDLYYDERDEARQFGPRLSWLEDVGALPSALCDGEAEGFLFSFSNNADDYCRLIAGRPHLDDQPGDRIPLLTLSSVSEKIIASGVKIPLARTWLVDSNLDLNSLSYPVLVRPNRPFLDRHITEAVYEDRKALGAALERKDSRDLVVQSYIVLQPGLMDKIARFRVWVIDQKAHGWSLENQKETPTLSDRQILRQASESIAPFFGTRLLTIDFARLKAGGWVLFEAGPGSMARSEHEELFKSVALTLAGRRSSFRQNSLGGCYERAKK
jgi:hypothetical protein